MEFCEDFRKELLKNLCKKSRKNCWRNPEKKTRTNLHKFKDELWEAFIMKLRENFKKKLRQTFKNECQGLLSLFLRKFFSEFLPRFHQDLFRYFSYEKIRRLSQEVFREKLLDNQGKNIQRHPGVIFGGGSQKTTRSNPGKFSISETTMRKGWKTHRKNERTTRNISNNSCRNLKTGTDKILRKVQDRF